MDWFTSDLHLGHENIISFCDRPYSSLEEMNDALIDNWNSVVDPDDRVWVLGDLAMGQLRHTVPLLGRAHGTKILVAGNHDSVWEGNRTNRNATIREERLELYTRVFDSVVSPNRDKVIPYRLGARNVLLSHFPYETDWQGRADLDEFKYEDEGDWLLHGHVHTLWGVNGRQVNVGVDVWDYHPVSRDTLRDLIDELERSRAREAELHLGEIIGELPERRARPGHGDDRGGAAVPGSGSDPKGVPGS